METAYEITDKAVDIDRAHSDKHWIEQHMHYLAGLNSGCHCFLKSSTSPNMLAALSGGGTGGWTVGTADTLYIVVVATGS